MSATETTKPEAAKLSVAGRRSLYETAHQAGIVAAATVLHEAEETLAVAQRAIGRVVNAAVAALMASGGTAEEAQKMILSDIGGDYSWSYVSTWQRAAVVFDSLTEANQALYGDSTESLKVLGRIPEERRNETAAKLAKNGKAASVRVLRDAAERAKPKSKRKRGTANGADAIVQKAQKIRNAVKIPTTLVWSPAVQKAVTELCEVSAVAVKGSALSKSQREAVATLSYFGPKSQDS